MLRSMWFVLGAAVLGGALGEALSYLISAPPGSQHSCPGALPGAPPPPRYTCQYPPDQGTWSLAWVVGGVLVAGFVAFLVRGHLRDVAEAAEYGGVRA